MAAVCVPFQLQVGLPYVFMTINGPDSEEAAGVHADSQHPDWNVAAEHSMFRLFVNLEDSGYDYANCNEGCGFDRPGAQS